ncbi:neogenin isoform X2 [Pygocentrus nattereri]|uniref:neogenin isoform X2 n=1 Tax=Pygocentrus nattereri TaxID=42514 RepID=UPI0008146A90|nr:neogenin isoform X2 [Pygocentrus nattereri]
MAERGARWLLFFSTLTSSLVAADKVRTFTPFRFSVEPVDTLAVRGLPAVLNCSVSSKAPVRVEWKKDGTFPNLAADDRRRLVSDGSLLISTVVHSKHNKPDEGVYQCVATIDNLGTISSRTARLTVAGLPRFSSQPEGVSVRPGGSEVLSCEVSAELIPFTHWEKSGQAVETDSRVVQLPSGALVISNASQADAGSYRCVIEGLGPAKSSEDAQLQILPDSAAEDRMEVLLGPTAMTKAVGETVLLPCVVKGYPLPIIRWMLDGKLINESDGRFAVIGGGILQITSLTENDAGTYSCQADNGNETIETQAQLTVQVPPRFLKKPSNMYAHEAMDIIFECEVTGSPAPTVKWLKNGDAVIPSDYFKIVNQNNLQVLGLVRSDEGFYQCLAENEAGNIQASAQLIILDLDIALPTSTVPSLTSATTDHVASGLGERLGPTPSPPRDVVASLVSTRFIKLTWRLPAEPHGENITYSVFYSLVGSSRERVQNTSAPGEMQVTIQNLIPDTKYTFRVVASNRNGLGESSTPLTVATQPEVQVPGPAPNLQAVSVTSTSVILTWERPVTGNGEIQTYKLYYSEKGQDSEQDMDVVGLAYTMTGLKKFTEYSFRVVAYNKHGPGVSTEDLTVQTLSDVPSAAPQNLSLEVQNSRSIMVRWQPPPLGSQNGELTGYKIRYRKGGRKGEAAEIMTTQLSQLIDGLERGTEYSFRVSATTVNGSGPATEWLTGETFESDLDESQVPGAPSSLHVRPLVNSIVVSWTPPENQDIVVRGYSIGYGIGNPHAQTVKVDYKQRYYSIDNLEPSSHYVITLKAFNNMGEGIPVYESAITRPQSDPIDPDIDLFELFHHTPHTPAPDPSPMLPPVGVQASVISHDTIKVSWADNSLAKNQKITDSRFYTVRWKTNIPANTKYKVANTTTLTHTVMNLKPNTLYEFSVMVTKGRRSSTWSMTAHGTTFETLPTSAPKDVTVVSKEGRPRTININWQPPTEANGKITGYIIYYSTDVNAEVHDWVVEPVMGNRLTHQIQELTLDTTYYFKIQARNSKGMGPLSDTVQFRTPKAEPSDKMSSDQGFHGTPGGRSPLPDHGFGSTLDKPGITGSQENHILVIVIIVSVGVFTIIAVVVGAFLCTRRSNSHQKKKRAACKSNNGSHKYKSTSKDLKPPDLWIHHERLEMKPIDKSPEPNPVMTETPIPRSQDPSGESGHQRRNSFQGHEIEESVSTLAGRKGVRPKIMMPFDSQPPQPIISAHPIHSVDYLHHHHHHHYHPPPRGYLHHQISLRAPATPSTPGPDLDSAPSSESVRTQAPAPEPPVVPTQQSSAAELQHTEAVIKEEDPPSYKPPTAHVHPTHPMKSFAVPTVSVSAHNPPSSALPCTPLLAQPVPGVKTASIGTLSRVRAPVAVTVPSAPDQAENSKMLPQKETAYETDELSEEMAHLEGLMKDLNAITTA